jgi:hypothetical protein
MMKKGTYERTPEIREKTRQAHLGRKHDYPSGGSLPGVAEKIRQSWTPEKREAARQRGLRFAADRDWRDLIARSVMGELNPRYQDGSAASGYAPGFGRYHHELIRARAGYRCERCGREPKTLDLHHKDWSKVVSSAGPQPTLQTRGVGKSSPAILSPRFRNIDPDGFSTRRHSPSIMPTSSATYTAGEVSEPICPA